MDPWARRLRWEALLAPGDPVRVTWGYGQGGRHQGVGVIERVFGRSFRVRLTEDAPGGWPAGTVLKGVGRFSWLFAADWNMWNAVHPVDGWPSDGEEGAQ